MIIFDLPDNKELRLGDSNDLKLVHNGTDSVISNTTNDLNIIITLVMILISQQQIILF